MKYKLINIGYAGENDFSQYRLIPPFLNKFAYVRTMGRLMCARVCQCVCVCASRVCVARACVCVCVGEGTSSLRMCRQGELLLLVGKRDGRQRSARDAAREMARHPSGARGLTVGGGGA